MLRLQYTWILVFIITEFRCFLILLKCFKIFFIMQKVVRIVYGLKLNVIYTKLDFMFKKYDTIDIF